VAIELLTGTGAEKRTGSEFLGHSDVSVPKPRRRPYWLFSPLFRFQGAPTRSEEQRRYSLTRASEDGSGASDLSADAASQMVRIAPNRPSGAKGHCTDNRSERQLQTGRSRRM